jgi:hypothetical protein
MKRSNKKEKKTTKRKSKKRFVRAGKKKCNEEMGIYFYI